MTTVFDLLAAQLGVRRGELPGEWPDGYDDPQPYTPAWQEATPASTGRCVIRVAREFARNAERSSGRSMIMMGGGTNHWYHSDQIYRSMLTLVLLCGCQGVNGGGWAHYVGQEKVRPITGWSTLAFAGDWVAAAALAADDAVLVPDERPVALPAHGAGEFASALGKGTLKGMHLADWSRSRRGSAGCRCIPGFDRNPLDLADEAEAAGSRRPTTSSAS